jgi:protein CWC15
MGSRSSQGCQRRFTPVLRTGHGCTHETQIPVFLTRLVSFHSNSSFADDRQPGQTSEVEVKKRDLRAELLIAEQEAKNKKRKAEGKAPLPVDDGQVDDEANKRRKLLQQALELDKDDDDEGGSEREGGGNPEKLDGDDRCVFVYISPHFEA